MHYFNGHHPLLVENFCRVLVFILATVRLLDRVLGVKVTVQQFLNTSVVFFIFKPYIETAASWDLIMYLLLF